MRLFQGSKINYTDTQACEKMKGAGRRSDIINRIWQQCKTLCNSSQDNSTMASIYCCRSARPAGAAPASRPSAALHCKPAYEPGVQSNSLDSQQAAHGSRTCA